ncbi:MULTISPECIES: DUF350 domain-containing protein [Cytobacillus]|uniref:DUF350 domain-containing protein n=1 Tax=Cytobacillus stercorigallinarum TaxID=2762240 RepID=A0ABR8QJM1_9BACI|nr:DUF350 domain-containing protein [Cytobacillus stercorigallinarum]MBD7935624.1 DUF350 domain-containing protein [Cytobacillus stercorigallinarum]
MNQFWENEFVHTAAYFSVVILCMIVFLAVFELVTKYKNWEEIKKGNVAVAMATGGKIFGIANVFRHSIMHNDHLLVMIGWGVFGFILLIIAYFVFEFMSPNIKVDDEIQNNNIAVGLISMILSIGISYIIGASIS